MFYHQNLHLYKPKLLRGFVVWGGFWAGYGGFLVVVVGFRVCMV